MQTTVEFSCNSMDHVADEINMFMENYCEDHNQELTIASVHEFHKIFPGDGKTVPYLLVVFNVGLISEAMVELARGDLKGRV